MTPHEVEAIVGGYHGDPFRVLGPHQEPDGWEVRATCRKPPRPGAVDGAPLAMEKIHPQGFFIAARPAPIRAAYRLALKLWNGAEKEIDDPYRFPPLLTSFDLHLHGEGTFYESFETMGAHLVTCEGYQASVSPCGRPTPR